MSFICIRYDKTTRYIESGNSEKYQNLVKIEFLANFECDAVSSCHAFEG